jgi:hypothetical protein
VQAAAADADDQAQVAVEGDAFGGLMMGMLMAAVAGLQGGPQGAAGVAPPPAANAAPPPPAGPAVAGAAAAVAAAAGGGGGGAGAAGGGAFGGVEVGFGLAVGPAGALPLPPAAALPNGGGIQFNIPIELLPMGMQAALLAGPAAAAAGGAQGVEAAAAAAAAGAAGAGAAGGGAAAGPGAQQPEGGPGLCLLM